MEHEIVDVDLPGFIAWRCTGPAPTSLSYVVEVGAPQLSDGTPVRERGSVLLLHELTGVSPETVRLAGQLRAAGYRVWMPVFFGPPGTGVSVGRGVRLLCVRSTLRSLALRGRTPISEWLAALVDVIVDERAAAGVPARVTAVGMCLTGGLVISLVLRQSPVVTAAVAAQPSSPIRPGVWQLAPGARNLGLTDDERSRAATNEVPVLSLSFRRDVMCPARRRGAVRDLLGDDDPVTLDGGASTVVTQRGHLRQVEAAGAGHATLTLHADRAGGETVDAVLAFLDEHHPIR